MLKTLNLSNWKGLTKELFLTDRMILVGRNGSGKTGILEAIQALFLGYTALGKQVSSTVALVSDKTGEISGELADGRIVSRKFTKKSALFVDGKEAKELPEDLRITPEVFFPGEFLGLSGDKKAQFLFNLYGAKLAGLPFEEQQKIFPELASHESTDFNWFIERLGMVAKTVRAELERCELNVQKLSGLVAEMPSGSLEEFRGKLVEIEKGIEEKVKVKAGNDEKVKVALHAKENIETFERQLEISGKKIKETETKIETSSRRLAEIVIDKGIGAIPNANPIREKLGAKKAELASIQKKFALLKEKPECPTCGTPTEGLEILDFWDLAICNLESEIPELEKELAGIAALEKERADLAKLAQEKKDLELALKVDKDALAAYLRTRNDLIKSLEKARKNLLSVGVTTDEVLEQQILGLKKQKEEIRENLRKFDQRQGVQEQRAKAEKERMELSSKQDRIKEATKKVKEMRDNALLEISGKIGKPFLAMAEIAFPNDRAFFEIVPSASGRPEIEFGLIRNERQRILFDTLSGGERALFLASLTACFQAGKSPIGLFELAELDNEKMEAFMRAVSTIGFKQVICATWRDNFVVPEGWEVIRLGVE